MEIIISNLLELKEEHADCVVVLDIFRASNTILSILNTNPQNLYVYNCYESYLMSEKSSNHKFFTELKVEKDFDNSPSTVMNLDLKEFDAHLLSSNGTKAINAYIKSNSVKDVLVGSLTNISYLKEYISLKKYKKVILEAVGSLDKKVATYEDEKVATIIKKYILDDEIDNDINIKNDIFKETQIMRKIDDYVIDKEIPENDIFQVKEQLIKDVEICLTKDLFEFVGIAKEVNNGVVIEMRSKI